MTKSHIPALNVPARIDITPADVTIQRKLGRPISRIMQNNAVGVTSAEVIDKILEEIGSRT
jgi:hypothetical protein